MINLNIPKLDEVIAEANKKGLTPYSISKGAGISTQTAHAYFKGSRVSTRNMEKIVNFINNYKCTTTQQD